MLEKYPLKLEPQVKEIVWGGRWLADTLGRAGKEDASLGESWEAYSGSKVTNGSLAGKTLGQLFQQAGAGYFGEAAAAYPRFPLLVKFIDARDNLSVQVHPDDALARQLENYPYGKTEFWYVIQAEAGAEICFGLNDTAATSEQIEAAIKAGTLLELLQRSPVEAGDVIFIPAGTVHALTSGIVVYELQQDCDITYRLYDWGRTGREIHIEKGLQAVNLAHRNPPVHRPRLAATGPQTSSAELISCPYFTASITVTGRAIPVEQHPASFTLITALTGSAQFTGPEAAGVSLAPGDTVLIPAGLACNIEPSGAEFKFISGWLNQQ